MKLSCLMLLFCLFSARGFSQKVIEKNIKSNTQKIIDIDLNIADSITIVAWNKNETYARATININNNRDNDLYDYHFTETPDKIHIEGKIQNSKANSDSCRCSLKTQINWLIYIPRSTAIKIKTINGNILITGETGPIDAYSISGYLDVAIRNKQKATFNMNTLSGTIYTNVPFVPDNTNKRNFTKIVAQYNGGGDEIKLKTISGDVHVRKSEN